MRMAKLVIVFSLGLALAGVQAQQPIPIGPGGPGGGYGQGPGGAIVIRQDSGRTLIRLVGTNEALQKELKLDDDAIKKITQALGKVEEDTKEDRARLRDPRSDLKPEELTELNKKVNDAFEKCVSAVLNADQMKRVHQIENQQLGLGLFDKEDIKKTLKLTDDQQDDIKDIKDALDKDTRDLLRPGKSGRPDPEAQKKLQAQRKDAMDRIVKLLSDSQNKALKDMLGETFDLSQLRQGGPGGGAVGSWVQLAGQILSQMQKDRLELTDDQKKQIEDLQKEVDARMAKILTDKQKKALEDLKQNPLGGGVIRGPGGNP